MLKMVGPKQRSTASRAEFDVFYEPVKWKLVGGQVQLGMRQSLREGSEKVRLRSCLSLVRRFWWENEIGFEASSRTLWRRWPTWPQSMRFAMGMLWWMTVEDSKWFPTFWRTWRNLGLWMMSGRRLNDQKKSRCSFAGGWEKRLHCRSYIKKQMQIFVTEFILEDWFGRRSSLCCRKTLKLLRLWRRLWSRPRTLRWWRQRGRRRMKCSRLRWLPHQRSSRRRRSGICQSGQRWIRCSQRPWRGCHRRRHRSSSRRMMWRSCRGKQWLSRKLRLERGGFALWYAGISRRKILTNLSMPVVLMLWRFGLVFSGLRQKDGRWASQI